MQIANMTNFSGLQYIAIDVANSFGLDKLDFEPRIQWVKDNLHQLESLETSPDIDKKSIPLYRKAVMALRTAMAGNPTGHMVGLDAACSGMQIMSCLTGCMAGATATGLILNKRMDAYGEVTKAMNEQEGIFVKIPRSDAKTGVMTSLYGSRAEPKKLFGEDTPELNAFYKAMGIVCPGAWALLDDLLESWNPYALAHTWVLPDGFVAHVKVMQKMEKRIEVDELDHATFTYEFFVNEGSKTGLSNVANAVHSVDAYVLRSMVRRCNYNVEEVSNAADVMSAEISSRYDGNKPADVTGKTARLEYYIQHFKRSTVADITILKWITAENVGLMETKHMTKLLDICIQMLKHKPFEIVTIHDAYHAHPNNCNYVRSHYREILADLADSNLLDDLLSQLYGEKGSFPKLSTGMGDLIRQSNYALA